MGKSHIFTFYSYKGGSGRSTTLANTALHLAKALKATRERPILIVDADLESAGLTYLFNCEKKFSSTDSFIGTVNTEQLLNVDENNYFGKAPGKRFIGTSDYSCESNCGKIVEDKECREILTKLKENDAEELLSGILVELADYKNLELIIKGWKVAADNVALHKMSPEERTIVKDFKLDTLMSKLRRIARGKESEEEKLRQRTAAVLDMLPAREPVDISEFYGLEPGSVRFLGVNVRSLGSRMNPESDNIIRVLAAELGRPKVRYEADKPQYQAILFDSASGTQSTADSLHQESDVLVYCMRPTQQFIRGTSLQLIQYHDTLADITDRKDGKKTVILLPTAVPNGDGAVQVLREASFSRIAKMVEDSGTDSEVVDARFCDPDKCLREVSLFKWREHILGAPNRSGKLAEFMECYTDPDTLPDDAKAAYRTYSELAACMLENV